MYCIVHSDGNCWIYALLLQNVEKFAINVINFEHHIKTRENIALIIRKYISHLIRSEEEVILKKLY